MNRKGKKPNLGLIYNDLLTNYSDEKNEASLVSHVLDQVYRTAQQSLNPISIDRVDSKSLPSMPKCLNLRS